MQRYIAFLRAVNVGGRVIKMEALRAAFEGLGFKRVETFIASGNVIFETRSASDETLRLKIEARLRETFGYEVATFVRTDSEVVAVAAYQPFPRPLLEAATALNVGFLAAPLGADEKKTLLALKTDIDDFHVHGREIYWACRKKQSES